MAMKKKIESDLELVPDAWPRFERFIKQIAKVGPAHREDRKPVKKKSKAKKSKKG
jgi:hypothetical protein